MPVFFLIGVKYFGTMETNPLLSPRPEHQFSLLRRFLFHEMS
jgi:hypothetical protein